MTDERYTFESTRARLDEILVAVRKKDTSLEQSLELLEEGVRLANMCNELIDQTGWKSPEPSEGDADAGPDAAADDAEPAEGEDAPVSSDEASDDGPGEGAEPEPEAPLGDAVPDEDAAGADAVEDDERD